MDKICLLDLDGVIFDFVGASLAHHGKSIPRHEVTYDFWKQVGMTGEEFFRPLRNREFWANLPFTQEAHEILRITEELFSDRVYLMTQAPDLNYGDGSSLSILGKMDAILEKLPQFSDRYFIGRPKGVLGHDRAILIDDTQDHIEDFEGKGGHTFLVPRPWNFNRWMLHPGTDTFHIEHLRLKLIQFLDQE